MIRYLKKDEYGACKGLWREAFPEDSREFTDYYFNKKLLQGRVMVKEDGTGRIVTMAHLNPYQVKTGSRVWTLDYIVGVATAADSRHQGHMRDVLVRMLLDMHNEGKLFCYLMPASPDIYRPFGFRYIFDQPGWRMKREAEDCLSRIEIKLLGTERNGADPDRIDQGGIGQGSAEQGGIGWSSAGQAGIGWSSAGQAGIDQGGIMQDGMDPHRKYTHRYIADWINRWMSERYEVYALRDPGYMEMLKAELDSEAGRIYGWYGGDGGLEALQAFWGRGKSDQRFLYCARHEWTEPENKEQPARPAIMARITNVAAFAGIISLDEESPCAVMEIKVRIHDALIPGNNGLWNWKLDRNGSVMDRAEMPWASSVISPESGARSCDRILPESETLVSTEVLDISIEQLASWLFGYRSLDEVMETEPEELPFWHIYIRPLRGVFLDEIV